MSKSVLYFTPLRWQLHEVGSLVMHWGNVIRILNKEMYGKDYFQITYIYEG